MKRFSKIVGIFILSTLILLGSGGFIIGRMICSGSGYTLYSIGNAKDCCGEKSTCRMKLTLGCCDLKNIYLSLPEFNYSNKLTISTQLFSEVVFILSLNSSLDCRVTSWFIIPKSISPPYSAKYLYFLSSLRM